MVLRPYGGLGLNLMFTTPAISAGLVNDAIGERLSGDLDVDAVVDVMSSSETQRMIVDEIIRRLLTPHFGMDIILGFMLKPPVVPIGLYVDGKFAIPFGKLDDNANVTGLGLKLNAGLCLHFGKKR